MTDTVWQGRFLEIRKDGRWEYAARKGDVEAAVILAIDDGHVVLVEQYRAPVAARCLELPAGLIGDENEGERVADAAIRELEEETGYRAASAQPLGRFCSSPGLTSERFTVVRASGLTRTGDGGGIAGEDIAVHRVALTALAAFVADKRASGVAIDARLLMLLGPGF